MLKSSLVRQPNDERLHGDSFQPSRRSYQDEAVLDVASPMTQQREAAPRVSAELPTKPQHQRK